jgi:hypothetical protein
MWDPARDYDPGNRAFYMRLGLILTAGAVAIGIMLLAGPK